MNNELETKKIWDPFGRNIRSDTADILAANRNLEKKIDRYNTNPWLAKGIFILIILIDLVIFAMYSASSVKSGAPFEVISEVILLPIVPCIYYYGILKPTQADIMRLLLARSLGFLYRSGNEIIDAELYISPELIFRKGVPKVLDSQFWGSFESHGQAVSFWFGEMVNPSVKDDYRRQFAILLIPKELPAELSVVSRSNVFDKLNESLVRTESVEFNKYFYIEPANSALGQNIFQVMTPSVLDAVVELRKVAGMFRLTFCEGKAVFIFATPFFELSYSNLLKSTSIDQRDSNVLREKQEKISKLLGLISTQLN